MIDERYISYLWFNKLFDPDQHTLLGEKVEIISVGTPNHDAGPDVFNAKIRIDGQLWAGNVEFHLRASHWHRHHHDTDPAYRHIILHVTLDADEQITDHLHRPIPTIALSHPTFIRRNYETLLAHHPAHTTPLPCHTTIPLADTMKTHAWIDRLLTERLEEKTTHLRHILTLTRHDWEETFYIALCRAMGFGTNSDAMQSLARSIPLKTIAHHRDHIEQIEALLLGQAGLLQHLTPTHPVEHTWIREYQFLKNKFHLTPPDPPALRMLRMRPPGFPSMRIAQTAAILHTTDHLFRRTIEAPDLHTLRHILSAPASPYWTTHYYPGRPTAPHTAALSRTSVDSLIINTVVPLLFLYGTTTDQYHHCRRATDLLRQLPAETNHIIRPLLHAGIPSRTAYDTQALLHLSRHYCLRRDCLRCYFGTLHITRHP